MSTIYDIAKAAQTSVASVSRVLNGRGGVRKEKEDRIRLAMARLDFQPRWKAADKERVLVFLPDYRHALQGGYVAGVMAGIADAAFAAGRGIILRPFPAQGREVPDLRSLFLQEGVAGGILISMYDGYALPAKLDMAGLPHVVVGHKMRDDGIHQILLDDQDAGRRAAEFLISMGHHDIAMVSFSHLDHGHYDRFLGFSEAMEAFGRRSAHCVQCREASYSAGRSAAREVLSPTRRPTAVIITNEDLAAGFQIEAAQMGFRVPEDLSILAFEETDKLSLLNPPLTSMQIPAHTMGMEAVRILAALLGEAVGDVVHAPTTKTIPIPIIARHSTASPRKH